MLEVILGKSKAISTSKIRKITAIRKNRVENGSRALLFGSNPHSNGEFFSRSIKVFLERVVARVITINDSKNSMVAVDRIIRIIYFDGINLFDWKSNVQIY